MHKIYGGSSTYNLLKEKINAKKLRFRFPWLMVPEFPLKWDPRFISSDKIRHRRCACEQYVCWHLPAATPLRNPTDGYAPQIGKRQIRNGAQIRQLTIQNHQNAPKPKFLKIPRTTHLFKALLSSLLIYSKLSHSSLFTSSFTSSFLFTLVIII